jgi:hypothetical protein
MQFRIEETCKYRFEPFSTQWADSGMTAVETIAANSPDCIGQGLRIDHEPRRDASQHRAIGSDRNVC